jgi:hypothetical protein
MKDSSVNKQVKSLNFRIYYRKIALRFLKHAMILISVILFLFIQQAAAFTVNDFNCAQQGDIGGTCFYDPSASCPTTGSTPTTSFGPGTLPSYIKQPYNSIFTAAGNKFNVDPAVLVGIFYNEQYGYTNSVSEFKTHTMPNPPPPYGSGAKWAQSSGSNGTTWPDGTTGARGPFQFEPGTFASYEYVENGHPPADANDLADESFSAAAYLASLGATSPETEAKVVAAAEPYSNGYVGYGAAAWSIVQTIKSDEGTGSGPTAPTTPSTPTTPSSSCGATTSSATASCGSATGNAVILCEAEQYNGIYYFSGGGHGYNNFIKQCPASVLSGAASSSTSASPGPCATDCSGLVSVAVDGAFGQTFSWDVGGIETATADWKPISITSVQPGDVVTVGSDTHVEIVDHYDSSSGTLYTFGSHAPGQTTGKVSSTTSYWTGAYRYIGPGSS